MLEWLEGDAPLVGENRLTWRVDEHRIIAEGLTYVEGSYSHLECDVVNEHRRFHRTSWLTCTSHTPNHPLMSKSQHELQSSSLQANLRQAMQTSIYQHKQILSNTGLKLLSYPSSFLIITSIPHSPSLILLLNKFYNFLKGR